MFGAAIIFCIGTIITASAKSFAVFLLGRVIAGIAASGIFPTATIIVLDLVRAKRRGLFIGLLNSSYTAGIACSAAIGGALVPTIGWVRHLSSGLRLLQSIQD
jgi:predicted MFS family arabinose efflux permease